jgi:hypothetical protein
MASISFGDIVQTSIVATPDRYVFKFAGVYLDPKFVLKIARELDSRLMMASAGLDEVTDTDRLLIMLFTKEPFYINLETHEQPSCTTDEGI